MNEVYEMQMPNLERIEGTVEHVIFENQINGYAVCDISSQSQLVTLTGFMPDLTEGESIAAFGAWTSHPEYGEQFKVEYFEKLMPTEEREIEKYLASGILPGIGKTTARKIVESFGKESLEIIEHEHERLLEIKGLTPKKVETIYQKYIEQIGVKEIVMFFQKHGISANYAVKAFKKFGISTINLVSNNPYILFEEIDGITFKTADKLAFNLGFEKNSISRVSSGIRFVLQNAGYLNGHTYLPRYTLLQQAKAYLEVDTGDVEDVLSNLLISKKVVLENMGEYDAIYLDIFYEAERTVSRKLRELSEIVFDVNKEDVLEIIQEVETETGVILADKQKEAVKSIFENSALVITGGPGTGKTTIINTIIKIMDRLGKKVALTAPTGRAAKRMTELCGIESKTIHRLLEIMPNGGDLSKGFVRNEKNPLDCDVLIVDEMSMVDISLMSSLLLAIPIGARLIMVGDSDQLPSVGAGNVLKDIIDSKAVLCIKFTEIFRQARESTIVVNAHKINNGEYPMFNDKESDFFFVKRDNPYHLCNTIADLCENRLPRVYGVDKVSQIQILTPTRKTPIGVQNLNSIIQNRLNPPDVQKPEKATASCIYRLGDKVMQIRNNYQLEWTRFEDGEKGTGVFNGDVGFITEINAKKRCITVNFDDKSVVYDFLILDELELAYAITVHKSQGSEFDIVVMPMFETHRLLMTRNLLYTAITRAKKLVVLVGVEEVIKAFVDNNNVQKRFSGLKEKLRIY